MKFGKVAQLVLAIGIFAIAAIFLRQMYQGRLDEYAETTIQLEASQTLLLKLEADKADLEVQLSSAKVRLEQAQASLSEGKAKYPERIESIEYDELFFEMADDRDLEILRLTASDPSEQTVDDVTYVVTIFSLEVAGEVADIVDFVNGIAIGEDFTTTTVEMVRITVPEPLTRAEKEELEEQEAEEDGEEPESPSASIRVYVYSYEGE
jgi:hypothetical protein